MNINRAVARTTDPETSHEAAETVNDSTVELRDRQRAVRAVLRMFGAQTDEELFGNYRTTGLPRQSPSGLRTRRAELVKLGLVEKTNEKRRMKSTGNWAIVWKLK